MPGRLVGVWATRIEIVYGPHGGIHEIWWLDASGHRSEQVTGFAGLTRTRLPEGGEQAVLSYQHPDATIWVSAVTIWRETWPGPSYLTPTKQEEGVGST
jgi:hypothetical protein